MSELDRAAARLWVLTSAEGPGYPPRDAARARVVAIGNFDGGHRGHGAIAATARAMGAGIGGQRPGIASALTFEPHPRLHFRPEIPLFRLTQPALRARRLGRTGFDEAVILPFTGELAALPAEDFVATVLVAGLGARGVVVGEDFRFGKGRTGDADLLVREGRRHGFALAAVPPLRDETGTIISSTAIREKLAAGDILRANRMLGYAYEILGAIEHGAKRGRELGYPTANIRLDPANGLAQGIYAVRAEIESRLHDGVASFGRRPQFDNGAPLLEVHLFDFAGDLYGKTARVEFHGFIRGEARFASLDELIAEMDRDSAEARRILSSRAG